MDPINVLKFFYDIDYLPVDECLNSLKQDYEPKETPRRVYYINEANATEPVEFEFGSTAFEAILQILETVIEGLPAHISDVDFDNEFHMQMLHILNDALGLLYNQTSEDVPIGYVSVEVPDDVFLQRVVFLKMVEQVLPQIEKHIPIVLQHKYSYSDIVLCSPLSCLDFVNKEIALASTHENHNTHNGPLAIDRLAKSLSRNIAFGPITNDPSNLHEVITEAYRYLYFVSNLLSGDAKTFLEEIVYEYEEIYTSRD